MGKCYHSHPLDLVSRATTGRVWHHAYTFLTNREEHTLSVLLMDVCGLIMYVVGVARETTLDHATLIFEPHF